MRADPKHSGSVLEFDPTVGIGHEVDGIMAA
jgi:hypothetical protein